MRYTNTSVFSIPPLTNPKLLGQVRQQLRAKHYTLRMEQSFLAWIRNYILFHNRRNPVDMARAEIESFLSYLAVDRAVSPATQNLALSALLFLYKDVLRIDLPWLDEIIRSKPLHPLPVVLSTLEIRCLFDAIEDASLRLIVRLLYGTGMRLMEVIRLHIKDIDFSRNAIIVRDGKGRKDRMAVLHPLLREELQQHCAARLGESVLCLPSYVFAATGLPVGTANNVPERQYPDPQHIQRALKQATVMAGIRKAVTPYVLRCSFATHLLESGIDTHTVQELLGHSLPKTSPIYAHLPNIDAFNALHPQSK